MFASSWNYVTMSFVIVLFLCNILLIENISALSSSELSSGFVTQHHIFLLAWRAQAQLWRKLLTNQQPHKVHQTNNPWSDPSHLVFYCKFTESWGLISWQIIVCPFNNYLRNKGISDGLAQLKATWTQWFWYVKIFPCPHFPKRLRTLNGNLG